MKLFLGFVLAFVFSIVTIPAKAAIKIGEPVKLSFSSQNVGTSTWVALVNTTAKAVKGIYIANSATTSVKLGVCAASLPAGSETAQIVVPPSAAAAYVPLPLSGGLRLSVLSTSGTISSGELDASLLYY